MTLIENKTNFYTITLKFKKNICTVRQLHSNAPCGNRAFKKVPVFHVLKVIRNIKLIYNQKKWFKCIQNDLNTIFKFKTWQTVGLKLPIFRDVPFAKER